VITIRGARTHNLRTIDLDIPHGRLVALTRHLAGLRAVAP
jgi:excinuclease UvrABC ATPase subunit